MSEPTPITSTVQRGPEPVNGNRPAGGGLLRSRSATAPESATARPPRAAPSPAGGLVTQMAPPIRLPGEHFGAALFFWLLGAIGLVWVAPEVARGAFSSTHVVLVTHLFTLGWITTSIQGALYQFLPVALGLPIRSERAAHVSFGLYVPGLIVFLGGLLVGRTELIVAGAALFATGLVIFVLNLASTLWRVADRNLTWWSLAGAALGLTATIVLGGSLAGNLRWGYLGADRVLALAVHLHVAVFGWVMLVIIGVASRLLPMFLLSHGVSNRPGKAALGLLVSGVTLLITLHHALNGWITGLIATLIGGGLIAFLIQAALYFRHRMKPVLDPGMRIAAVAVTTLAVAAVIAPFFLVQGLEAPRTATAYVLALVGGLSLFVAGHYYKILPFLIWFHRFGPLVGKQKVPRVVDLYDVRPGNAAVGLLGVGLFGMILSTLVGAVAFARPAALLVLAGAVIVAAQMLNMSRVRAE